MRGQGRTESDGIRDSTSGGSGGDGSGGGGDDGDGFSSCGRIGCSSAGRSSASADDRDVDLSLLVHHPVLIGMKLVHLGLVERESSEKRSVGVRNAGNQSGSAMWVGETSGESGTESARTGKEESEICA